jgi:hypothetical protein
MQQFYNNNAPRDTEAGAVMWDGEVADGMGLDQEATETHERRGIEGVGIKSDIWLILRALPALGGNWRISG